MPFRNSTLFISGLLVTLTLQLVSCGKKEEPVSAPSEIVINKGEDTGASPQIALEAPKVGETSDRRRIEAYRTERDKAASRLEANRIEAAKKARSHTGSEIKDRLPESAQQTARAAREPASAEPKAASSELESRRDAFAAIDEAIQQMGKANIAFNAPKTMNRADTVMIQLLLSMSQATGELSKLLTGKGEKESAVVSVAGIMEARLSGPNFEITATTPEEQPISRLEKTEWRWDVKPKSVGEQDLHLTLTAIFDVEGTQRKRAIRTFDQIITVNVTTGQQLADFVTGNWQWLWAAVAVPLVGAIWQGKRIKRKQAKRRKS